MSRFSHTEGRIESVSNADRASPLHESARIRALNRHRMRDVGSGDRENRGADHSTGDLFAWGAKQRQIQDTGSLSARPPRASRPLLGLEKHSIRGHRDRRFRRFLASGSFGHGEPVEDDHWVLRNRIIFFGLFVAMIAFSLNKMLAW